MQLNMDGWGANEKYPHALGEPATSINRWYLKMKSELMPYAYSIAKEAVDGKPMIRAMFWNTRISILMVKQPNISSCTDRISWLPLSIRKHRQMKKGNDIRDGIYLPEGTWVDYFTGENKRAIVSTILLLRLEVAGICKERRHHSDD